MRTSYERWTHYSREQLAEQLSSLTRFFDRVVQWRPLPHDEGKLLSQLVCPKKTTSHTLPPVLGGTAVLLNGNLNHSSEILRLLQEAKRTMDRESRLVIVLYNPYTRGLFWFLNAFLGRRAEIPSTFLTRTDLSNLARLSGFEITRLEPGLYLPFRLWGLGTIFNRVLRGIPGLRWLGFAAVAVLRPVRVSPHKPSLSVIVPARNERENIRGIFSALRDLEDLVTEVIFVEGHSTDGTAEEIRSAIDSDQGPIALRLLQQTGKGKKDAVRLGFAAARGELLAILDADLTVRPENLRDFYEAWREGHADFINGSRLVYPLEAESMRFLNRLGNVFFAKALSFVLQTRLGDSLCGTKLVSRAQYERMRRWQDAFGDFDPFGDFELLFPAAALGMGIIDVPVPYRARRYGTTNIHRFRHGLELLRMTCIGLFTLRMGSRFQNPVPALDAPERLPEIRARIARKAALNRFYRRAYGKFEECLKKCPPEGLAIEIGSGGGFLKQLLPQVHATDTLPYEGLDGQVDATRMPYPDRSLRAIFLLDAFHHIPDVERFFHEAERCLRPGGRVFIVDQYPGWIGKWIYRYLHHEPFRPEATEWRFSTTGPLSGANGALAWMVFERDRQRFEAQFPGLRVARYDPHTPVLYWLGGGLKKWSLVPTPAVPAVAALDALFARRFPRASSFVDIELVFSPLVSSPQDCRA